MNFIGAKSLQGMGPALDLRAVPTPGDTEEWDSGVKSWLMLPEPKGFAMQVLSGLETDMCKHKEYWSTLWRGWAG